MPTTLSTLRAHWVWLFVLAATAGYRIALCLSVPAETSDVLRHLCYGLAFWKHGLATFDLTPRQLAVPGTWEGLWASHGYDYPIVPLLFFAALAKLQVGVFAAKLVLTAIEAVNAWLVFRITGTRIAGVLYFASPASLWWVSREGQFEPLVVLASLTALVCLRQGRHASAYVALALAVQAKLFPIFLLPAFLVRHRSPRALTAFVLAFLPSAIALTRSDYILPLFRPGYRATGYNPFAWNVFSREPFDWNPRFIVVLGALLTFGLLLAAVVLLIRAWRRHGIAVAVSYVPLVAYLVFIKSIGWGQFWYVLLLPSFVLAIEERAVWLPLLAASVLEGRATTALVIGPVGIGQWSIMDQLLNPTPDLIR